jgi:sugar (pentulose or hexulose) kinase
MPIKSPQAFFDYWLCVSDTEFNCRSHQQIASVLADEEHKTCSQACYVLTLLLRLVWLKTQQALTFMETKQMSVPKKYIHLKLSSTFNNAGWQNHNPASQ